MITSYELWTKRNQTRTTSGFDVVGKLFFVIEPIEPNELVLINSIIKSKDAIFDKNRFSSVPRPSFRIPNGTEDIGGSVVLEEVTEEDYPKTFDEAMKSHDVAFWKEAINDEMDSIMGNNTWVLVDLTPGTGYSLKDEKRSQTGHKKRIYARA
ncbi:hypothetical protein Tco_1228602 [Tanacetum coccineum]